MSNSDGGQNRRPLFLGIVLLEDSHALLQLGVLMVFDERRADTQTFLMRTRGYQTDSRYTVVHQLLGQLTAGHLLVTDGKVETVGNRFVKVFVIDHVEAVTTENLLQFVGTLAIDADLLAEIVVAVSSSFKHSRHCVLCRVAGT